MFLQFFPFIPVKIKEEKDGTKDFKKYSDLIILFQFFRRISEYET